MFSPETAKTSGTPSASELEAAFAMFNQLSNTLGDAYQSLEQKVADLSTELAEARSERLNELAAKEALASRITALLDILPAGVVVVDQNDRIAEVNPEAAELLCCDVTALIGRRWSEILKAAASGAIDQPHNIELKSGKRISMSVRLIEGRQGEVVLLTDVSDFYEMQEWMNREKRMTALGEMTARMAHQLRTPLSTALLYMSQIQDPRLETGDRNRVAGKVTAQLKDIENLVVGMLSFVRGCQQVETEVSAEQLLADLDRVVRPQVDAHRGKLTISNAAGGNTIRGNREALLSALVNLVENAIQHSVEPVVCVSASIIGDEVDFVVSDNGEGVPAGIADQIFDPFFTTRGEGNGMGLAIVALTAREYGGDVTLADTDTGATFHFRVKRDRSRHASWQSAAAAAETIKEVTA